MARGNAKALGVGVALGLTLFALMAPTAGLPSRPTFTQVRVGNQVAPVSTSQVELQTASGADPTLRTYRASSGVGVGVGRVVFDGIDVGSTRQTYGLIQGEIEVNTAGSQGGALVFQTAKLGVNAEKMRITASGEIRGRGVAVTAYKAGFTDRVSTITPVSDPDLQIALQAGVRYNIRIVANYSNITTNTQGGNFQLNFSGGASDGNCSLRTSNAGTATPYTPGIALNTTYSLGSFAAAGVTYPTEIDCAFTATAAGTFIFQFAQATSGANATRVGTGSYIVATRLN